jgi:4'-phosphopantetheinyl transferase
MKNNFKTLTLADCQLKSTRIDIWQYPLHTSWPEADALLNDEESARAKRYHFEHHRRRYTIARAMLRLILSHYLQQNPMELVFSYNAHGKPSLLDFPTLQFNLSHSGELALLAVGSHFPVGIDLEFFSARPYRGIGQHLFSYQENLKLCHVNQALEPLAFFHVWAQKEAFIKACGLGLAYPTKQFDVALLPSPSYEVLDQLHQTTWHMKSFMPEIACNAALCHHPSVTDIYYLKLTELKSIMTQLSYG